MLTGGCLCGAVRYEAGGTPFHATFCHCSMCRRAAGAPVVAWFSVARAAWRITSGTPARYRSSAQAVRTFCGTCGTTLTYEADDLPEEIDIATASLDDPEAVPPQDHVRVSSRLRWLRVNEDLPTYPEGRADPPSSG